MCNRYVVNRMHCAHRAIVTAFEFAGRKHMSAKNAQYLVFKQEAMNFIYQESSIYMLLLRLFMNYFLLTEAKDREILRK
jgi:hypothetical protein